MLSGLQLAASSKNINQFSKFILVGCSNFAISFAVFFLFYNYLPLSAFFNRALGILGDPFSQNLARTGTFSLDATLANIFGYSAGIANSFIWNKLWTFKAKLQTAMQLRRFLALNLFCLLLSSASLFLFTDYLNWPYLPVWFGTMAGVTLLNFGFSKYWVFRVCES